MGGSCRTRRVQEYIKELFPNIVVDYGVDFDTSISIGACLKCAINEGVLEGYKLDKIVPMNIGPMVQDPLRIYPILKAGDQQGEEHKKVSEKFENQDDYKETWKIQIHQGDEIKKGHEDDSWVCDFTMTGLTKAKAGKTTIQIKLWVDEATGMLRGEGWETNLENAVVQQLEHQLDFKTISQEVNDAI